jgi:hypothetical protein
MEDTMAQKRYALIVAAGIAIFITLGIGSFYLGEWMNAPTGVIEDTPEAPDASR